MNGDNPSQSRPLAASLRKGAPFSGWAGNCLDGRQKKPPVHQR
ncbi:hypothetical protein [Salmonella enterica]